MRLRLERHKQLDNASSSEPWSQIALAEQRKGEPSQAVSATSAPGPGL
jgi:hypothetical protein